MLRRSILFVGLLTIASILVYAQDKKPAEITGFLIDNMCATGMDSKDKEHPTSCALMEACQKSGFAVVAKDTLYKLDENGNNLALEILKNTKTKKGLAVQIKGTVVGDVLQVDSITEVTN